MGGSNSHLYTTHKPKLMNTRENLCLHSELITPTSYYNKQFEVINDKHWVFLPGSLAVFFLLPQLWSFSVTAVWSLTQRSTNSVSSVLSCGYEDPASSAQYYLSVWKIKLYSEFVLLSPLLTFSNFLSLFSFCPSASPSCSSPPFPMRSLRPSSELVWLLRAVPVLLETPLQYSY